LPQPDSPDSPLDFAIFGSGPLARLLAGTLAADHGKRVALVAERFSALRLPRGFHLSALPATRPETWERLRQYDNETIALLARAGAQAAVTRIDVTYRADSAATMTALEHVRHMAMGFGLATDTAHGGQGVVISGVARIDEDALHAALAPWLEKSGVVPLSPDATVAFEKSGPIVVSDQRRVSVRQIVLVDDQMIADHLPNESWPEVLTTNECSATLTSVTRTPIRGVTAFLDRGVTLTQRGGGILVAVDGSETIDQRLASALTGYLPLVRLATRRYHNVITRDGAPLVGWLKAPKVFVATSLGSAGAFFAPALARALTSSISSEEKAWFVARDPARLAARGAIVDLGARAA
jgi:hypothetical protein